MSNIHNGRVYLGQQQEWVVRFKDGSTYRITCLFGSNEAIRKACRTAKQSADNVIEVVTLAQANYDAR